MHGDIWQANIRLNKDGEHGGRSEGEGGVEKILMAAVLGVMKSGRLSWLPCEVKRTKFLGHLEHSPRSPRTFTSVT